MIDACDAAGVRLMIHENWRFRPWYRALRAEIDAGTIGRPIRLRIAHRDTRALRPDGFADQPFLADDAPADPDGDGLPPGRHGPLPDRRGPDRSPPRSAGSDRATPARTSPRSRSIFAGGALGLLDMSWCAPADLARPEWALNETVVEGTAGTLKVQPDGSLLFVGLTAGPSAARRHAARRRGLRRRATPPPRAISSTA